MAKQTVSLTVKQKAGVTINATWLLNIGRIETVTAQGTDAVIEYRESPTELHVLLVDESKAYVDLRAQGYDDTTYTSLNVLDIDGVAVNAARTFAISGLIYAFADPLTSAHSIIVYSEDGGDTNNVRVDYTLAALQDLLIPTVDESGTLLSFGTYGDYRVLSNASGDSVPIQVALESQTNATVADTSFLGLYVSVKNTTAQQGNNKMQGILSSTKLNKNCFDAYGVQGHVSVDTGMSTLNANAHITGISGKATLTGAVGQGWVTGGLFILDGAAAVTGLCHGVAIVAEVGVTATDAMLYITNSGNATVGIDLQGGYTTAVNIPGTYTTGMRLAGTYTTGIASLGTCSNGIDFSGATLVEGNGNAFVNIGNYAAAKSVALATTNFYQPLQVNLLSSTNPTGGETIMSATYFKVATTGNQADLNLVGNTVRVTVGGNVAQAYGVQSHLTVSGACVAGVNANVCAGSFKTVVNANTTATVNVMLLTYEGTGTVTGETNMMTIDPTVACKNGFMVYSTANLTNLFEFAAAAGCVGITAAGNGGFVSNNLGTLTLVGFTRILVGGSPYYVPYGTIA